MLRCRFVVFSLAALVLAQPSIGQITPPPGPPAETFKTLDEVEPRIPLTQQTAPGNATFEFEIDQPGSYYLTGNVTTAGAKGFLYISAVGDVSLDLMGYTVTSSAAGELTVDTVGGGDVQQFALMNGTIHGGRGVFTRALHNVFKDLAILDTTFWGIHTTYQTVISDTVIDGAAQYGVEIGSAGPIVTGFGVRIERTVVRNIDGIGIAVQDGARLIDVTIQDVTSTALSTGDAASITGLLVFRCGQSGSPSAGVSLDPGSKISDSTISGYAGNGRALWLRADCLANLISVTDALSGTGVYMESDSMLTNSLVRDTGITGVEASGSNTIKFNTIRRASAGGYAIDAGSGNVIDQNRIYGSVRYVSSNVVTRNSLRTGSYSTTGVSNTVGPINDINSPWANWDK